MKKLDAIILGSCLLAGSALWAQGVNMPATVSSPIPAGGLSGQPVVPRPAATPATIDPTTGMPTGMPVVAQKTRFDLTFPGGTPGELAKAIETSMGKPINLIIPKDAANIQIPPLKMAHVALSDLFKALSSTSVKTEDFVVERDGEAVVQRSESRYLIQSQSPNSDDDAVWYLVYENRSRPPVLPEKKVCRFFNLAPYLEGSSGNLKIEAITTAIETGWKMLGEQSIPAMKFHPDTKLLIAVGEPRKLEMIDMALKQLGQRQPSAFEQRLQDIVRGTPTPPPTQPLPPPGGQPLPPAPAPGNK